MLKHCINNTNDKRRSQQETPNSGFKYLAYIMEQNRARRKNRGGEITTPFDKHLGSVKEASKKASGIIWRSPIW